MNNPLKSDTVDCCGANKAQSILDIELEGLNKCTSKCLLNLRSMRKTLQYVMEDKEDLKEGCFDGSEVHPARSLTALDRVEDVKENMKAIMDIIEDINSKLVI